MGLQNPNPKCCPHKTTYIGNPFLFLKKLRKNSIKVARKMYILKVIFKESG
jgi:hypothetical protein